MPSPSRKIPFHIPLSSLLHLYILSCSLHHPHYLINSSISIVSLFDLCSLFLLTQLQFTVMAAQNSQTQFQDFLPVMANKLGGDGLIDELCNGFNLLKDSEKGVITFDSLKRNSALLGLQGLSDEDLRSMLVEGDFDGDGALNQLEFCVLMFRLSPELMEGSKLWLEQVLQQELKDYF